jgi:hypothetical protein
MILHERRLAGSILCGSVRFSVGGSRSLQEFSVFNLFSKQTKYMLLCKC